MEGIVACIPSIIVRLKHHCVLPLWAVKRDYKEWSFSVSFSFVNEKVASGLKIVEMETEIDMICIYGV